MSNKLIKNSKSIHKDKKEQKKIITLSIVDIVLAILLSIGLLIQSKVNFVYLLDINLNIERQVKILTIIILIIIWLMLAIIFGIYQDKIEGTKTTVNDGFKELKRQSEELTQKDKLLNIVNSILRTYVIISCGMMCSNKLGVIFVMTGIIITVLGNLMHKFKIGDIGYTIYTIGAIGYILALII